MDSLGKYLRNFRWFDWTEYTNHSVLLIQLSE